MNANSTGGRRTKGTLMLPQTPAPRRESALAEDLDRGNGSGLFGGVAWECSYALREFPAAHTRRIATRKQQSLIAIDEADQTVTSCCQTAAEGSGLARTSGAKGYVKASHLSATLIELLQRVEAPHERDIECDSVLFWNHIAQHLQCQIVARANCEPF